MSDLVWPKKAEDSPSIEVEIVLPYVKNGLVDTNGAKRSRIGLDAFSVVDRCGL